MQGRLTSHPFGSSTETEGVDPRCDSLSRAYCIIVRKAKAQEQPGFQRAVTHVLGRFCNASAKYAQRECTGTSVTHWTGDIRYNPLAVTMTQVKG